MYETIVVGFDESPSSKAAVIEASNRIKRHGGKLFLAHSVFFDTEEFGIAPEQLEKRLRIGEKVCVEAKETITKEFNIDAHYILCEGEPPEVITEVAQGKNADLIMLGTYGRKGLNRLLMGSVTSQVILNASIDTLVVKKRCVECTGSYRSILVPFDNSDFSKKALNRACQLSKIDGAEVTVMYVIPRYEEMVDFFKTESIKNSLQQEAAKIIARAVNHANIQGVNPRTEIVEGQAADRIVESARRLGADLIAIGSHGYRGINKAIMGSTAERVILNSTCPVLVVR
ncbi:MAG: universal stress protein [Nitrospirae bacterium]|nr:universal stress protein [Nitrospirota bacterium]MBI5739548.1 universal stress protein [Nitrospirota bacterium]